MQPQQIQPNDIVPLTFGGAQSLAIYQPAASELLVIMINGGAQMRCGSHRMQQQIALQWQQAGLASLRFDFPGFGDAGGEPADFVRHAAYLAELPAQLEAFFGRRRPLVCFGLCDGATAALLASPALQPQALILLNPWLRTPHSHASAMLKSYYFNQLRSRQFWQKLLKGRLDWRSSLQELTTFWRQRQQASSASPDMPAQSAGINPAPAGAVAPSNQQIEAIAQALHLWRQLKVPCLLALAEPDLTAAECHQTLQQKQWRPIWRHCQQLLLPQANHTLSHAGDLQQFSTVSIQFLQTLHTVTH